MSRCGSRWRWSGYGTSCAAGVELVGDVDVSSDGRPCLFLHPRSTGGVLVELVEGERRNG